MDCRYCNDPMNRRTFLRFSLGAAGTAAAGLSLPPSLRLLAQDTQSQEPRMKAKAKACILLWMGGGPSQLDTWDPKPGQKTGGEFKAIDTAVRGVQISEHLPKIAAQAKRFSIIRSLTTMEAAHERGTYLMHVGYSPIPGLDFPALGTVISYENGDPKMPLPNYVAVQPPSVPQSPIFGEEHLPFVLGNIGDPVPNVKSPVGGDHESERQKLLHEQVKDWVDRRKYKSMDKYEASHKKADDLMATPLLKAFNIKAEPENVRAEYGGGFGANCLLARRLVEAGCRFVEVGLGGWDTHNDNFDAVKKLSEPLDTGMGTLIKDLDQKGLLKETMVIWAGEFGRTPEINGGKGRDHWTKCFSVVLAGGGIESGRVVGATDKMGCEIANRPVPIQDYFATIYRCLGIDPEKRYVVEGRKVKYAYNGKPVKELLT